MSNEQNPASGLIEFGVFLAIAIALVFGLWWALRPFIMWLSFYTSFFVFKYVYAHLSFLMTDADCKVNKNWILAMVSNFLDNNNIFCGVILDTTTILEILKLHIETNEPVKIPFNLYFN